MALEVIKKRGCFITKVYKVSQVCWEKFIEDESKKEYFIDLMRFLDSEEKSGKTIYPMRSNWFKAYELTAFCDAKVVIVGQDPYHGENQAFGLAFAVPSGVKIPPSLKNIFKELSFGTGFITPKSGDLTHWAVNGVFLINAVLTVEKDSPRSHQNRGWERFTDATIKLLSDQKNHLVFMLWGNDAQKKLPLIDSKKHLVLTSAHPSPLSAHRGFFGQNHFLTANSYLKTHKLTQIPWQVPIS